MLVEFSSDDQIVQAYNKASRNLLSLGLLDPQASDAEYINIKKALFKKMYKAEIIMIESLWVLHGLEFDNEFDFLNFMATWG